MVNELFLSINLVFTALKLFKIGKLVLFTSQFTFHILKRIKYGNVEDEIRAGP